MLDRRQFIKTAAAAGGVAATRPITALASRHQTSEGYFGLHDFVENHPEAVFIMKTNVDVKTNHDGLRNAGAEFARSVIVPKDSGVPLTHLIPIKPNITNVNFGGSPKNDVEYRMGIITDPWFVEGVIESMKELGLSGDQFHLTETWNLGNWGPMGYDSMAARTGANQNVTGSTKVQYLPSEQVVWKDVPDGVWFRRLPYIWPVNAENTWFLDIAKFKTHGMGVTLCCKNIQGALCHDHRGHCDRNLGTPASDKNPTAEVDIAANYERHLADGMPRWDRGGTSGGAWMEMWASRCLDNNSVTESGLHIIEGVYGRDGDGFLSGPNSGTFKNDEAWDYMTNIIIFGKDQYRCDIIGHWLAGHEPGNFGLFHMAIERGLSDALDPMRIPVYEWVDGQPVLTPLTDFERTPLQTYYLQKDGEDRFHMCDEPFDYGTVTLVDEKSDDTPRSFILGQNRPNPFNPYTSIEYSIPSSGNVRIEVYNLGGQLVDVLVDGWRAQGAHVATWNAYNRASGTYFYRFRYGGFAETRKMTLLK